MSYKNVNLKKIVFRKELMTIIILFFTITLFSQLNSEVGYSGAYLKADLTNTIINKYNSDNKMLSDMKSLNYIGGFHFGLMYRAGFLKIGGAWESLSAKRVGVEGDLNQNFAIEKKLYFYVNSLSGNIELLYRNFGIGGTVDKNIYKIKTIVNGTTRKIPVVEEGFNSSKVYLIFYLRGNDKIGIAFKPYVKVPWSTISTDKMADYLNVQQNPAFKSEKLMQFGLTFVLLNGKQKEL